MRKLLIWVWTVCKHFHWQKGMHWCTVAYIKLIEKEAKHEYRGHH